MSRTFCRSAAFLLDGPLLTDARMLPHVKKMDDASSAVGKPLHAVALAGELPGAKNADSDPKPSAPPRKPLLLAAAVVGAGLALVIGWIVLQPVEVDAITLTPQSVEIALSVVGRVQSRNTLDVRSQNAGQIVQLLQDEGAVVAKGAPLAVIRSDIEAAEAGAASGREQSARAEATRTQLMLTRTETLAAKGFASRAALDDARAANGSAQASWTAAASDRRAASAKVGEFTIRAPMAGLVLLRPIDNGQIITPATTLFQLGSSDARDIEAEVDEAYADELRPGMTARASPSGSKTVFPAHIAEISPRVDPATGGRTITLLPDTSTVLPPGRTIDVTIILDLRPNALVVPRQAIVDAGGAPRVYLVSKDGRIVVRPVELDAWPSLNAIITAGASAGDRVVLTPGETRPSAHVRTREASAPDSSPAG